MAGARKGKVRVLVVDDSAIARDLIERGLSLDPEIEVVGKAADVFAARDKIVFLNPDVLTLDVEMPRMDGIEFLRRLLPQYPIPAVVVSAVTAEGSRRALEALEAGAVDVVAKPSAQDSDGLRNMLSELRERVKEAARADVRKIKSIPVNPSSAPVKTKRKRAGGEASWNGKVVAIGASTGGTYAINKIVPAFPANMPPVVIVQHMPPVFTKMFADSLDKVSTVEVREAVDGDVLRPGLVLIAPGDFHLRLMKSPAGFIVRRDSGPKVSGHRPSVDVLFNSVAVAAGPKAVGLILTGMGRDGADGLLAMRRSGARCIAQDEESSVVFGMPKEAWDAGAAELLVPLDRAVEELLLRLGAISPAGGAV